MKIYDLKHGDYVVCRSGEVGLIVVRNGIYYLNFADEVIPFSFKKDVFLGDVYDERNIVAIRKNAFNEWINKYYISAEKGEGRCAPERGDLQ